MRRALIVALREYVENAKTKGFWLGILILPIMLTVGIEVPGYLERRAVPTRYFVLVDQSGAFEKVISAALDRDYQRQILQALNEYAERNAQTEKVRESRKKTGGELNLETIPAAAADPKKILDEFAESNPRALEFFMDKGGQDFFLAQIRPMLRKD
ncbi:hypothetical protein HY256_10985, partial [Candidatus Sumerlaeota bacterium]|nr:hypothetical protein [Candidatus Sumerlaeota bacterium]